MALFAKHPGRCRSVVGDLGELDLTLGLDALGGNLSDTSTDPFIGTRAANVVVSTAGKWVDELDATLWAWSHLLPDCLRTDEIIAIQVLRIVPALQWADSECSPLLPDHRSFRVCLPSLQPAAAQAPAKHKRRCAKGDSSFFSYNP